jgi:hypothetical protein
MRIKLDANCVGAQISIWQLDGRLIYKWKAEQQTESYSITSFKSGIYLVRVNKGATQREKKIVIIR